MALLVAYYSLTGNTRIAATALATELRADLAEIRCDRYKIGFWGFLRACGDSWKGNLPALAAFSPSPSSYDLVVIAGPIWAWHPSPPIRAFLRQFAAELQDVAFLLTHGGSAGEQSLREMERRAGKPPVAGLVLQEAKIKSGAFRAELASFSETLRSRTRLIS